ncbi:cytochrome P450 [Oceanicoccus sp. KOV_DT_Chl]|uniref:cytochrome P450 n=1 Tax=Oceanicoccus sp. KOV_DT_Chl TaxID=1904639 RepID=UPI000C7970E6|nr:cytochrome P450 [Oceanicoccus sp. KOV_DT_Chl]
MQQAQESLRPIEEVYNPNSQEYLYDPVPQCLELARRGKLVWYAPWQAWIMTQMTDIMDCWKNEYLSSDFYDWEFAPQRPPEEQWTNFERALIGHSLLADPDHHRVIRRVTSPAFSRNVVANINAKIEPDIIKLFDNLGTPDSFDYLTEVAQHIPFISIIRMVGVPEKYWDEIKPAILTFTQAWNPTISDEQREAARQDSNRAIEVIKKVIAERRSAPAQDDFLSSLLKVEAESDQFEEWDIITLILALIGAGADTTLMAQQWSVYSFLKNDRSQIDKALASPEAFSNAFSEIMRWSTQSKMGFARYAPADMDVLGQKVRKGQMVLMMPHLKDHDPSYYSQPEKLDVEREFNPDLLFGYGPRFCIGAALAKHQLFLSMTELFKRFPNLELDGEPERDDQDHNGISFKRLMVKTNCN